MNAFQWIALPLVALVASREVLQLSRGGRGSSGSVVRLLVWLMAMAAIAVPDLTSRAAQLVGIGRGADLVVYLFMLSAVVVAFHLYARQFGMQRDVVELARREALRTATAGRGLDPSGDFAMPQGAADRKDREP
jgi:small membrane protein